MYNVIRKSTVRMIVDLIRDLEGDIQYYEWDAHAESFSLPKKDLIGLMGFTITEDKPFYDLTFAVAIMTLNDPQIDRATRYADAVFARLASHKSFPVLDADGAVTGLNAYCFDGTAAGPIGRVDARPAMEITVSARVTPFEGLNLP